MCVSVPRFSDTSRKLHLQLSHITKECGGRSVEDEKGKLNLIHVSLVTISCWVVQAALLLIFLPRALLAIQTALEAIWEF